MKYNLPRPGYPATPQQQRDMLQTVGLINNPVLQSVGYNTVSVTQNGIETRDYTPERILGKITGHGTGNIYSFSQVIQTDETGTVAVLDGGVTGTTSNFSAFEMNGRTDVPTNAIVELVPTWGAIQGYGFIYNGVDTSSGTLADAAVHVTATSGGTYTVKRVNRDSGGTLVESSPTVTYTGVYEAQGRTAVVDPTSTPTHELPLFIDKNGKYYFQIDQYADGTASPVLDGIVSTADQTFEGPKHFNDEVEVNAQNNDGTGATADAVFVVNDSSSGDYLVRCFATGGPGIGPPSVVVGDGLGTGAGVNLSVAGVVSYGTQLVANDGTYQWETELNTAGVTTDQVTTAVGVAGNAKAGLLVTDTKGSPTTLNYFLNGGIDYDTAFTISGSNGSGTGQTGTYTFGGGATGDVASMTFVGGILTAVTLVP